MLTCCRLINAAWHMPASVRGKQLPRPLLHARNDPCLTLTSNCLLHMQRITWELLLGMVCTPGRAAHHDTALSRPVPTDGLA